MSLLRKRKKIKGKTYEIQYDGVCKAFELIGPFPPSGSVPKIYENDADTIEEAEKKANRVLGTEGKWKDQPTEETKFQG